MEQISASTQIVRVDSQVGSFDAAENLINNGAYTGWNLHNSIGSVPTSVQLYNKQTISLQGLVAGEQQFISASLRVEQAEPIRCSMGMMKDPNASPYGFVREYHLFTTEELNDDDLTQIFSLTNPTLPGMTTTAGTSSRLNENQLVYGIAREYNSILNMTGVGTTFSDDWRVVPSFENVLGNGYPVAQSVVHYTRLVYCWMNPTTTANSATSIIQGLDVPAARASLIGVIDKPNFQEYLATLANNEAIGSW